MEERSGENAVGSSIHNDEVKRQSIEAAIAKAKELRALNAALMLQKSSNNNSSSSPAEIIASPASRNRALHHFSAQDYPVFTPSYEHDPLPGYQSWGDRSFIGSNNIEESFCSDYRTNTTSPRKGMMPSEFQGHMCPLDDRALRSCSPVPNSYSKSRRNSGGDANSVSSCNTCRPAVISSEPQATNKNGKKSNTVVPLADSHPPLDSRHPRSRGLGFSRLFPGLKKKNNNNNNEDSSPVRSQNGHDVEALRKEVMEANESRELALTEAAEMKSSLGELSQKLESLERYCEELKEALRQAVQLTTVNPQPDGEKLSRIPRRGKSIDSFPVTEDVMVEGFLQIVSEARLSTKQLCKALLVQIEEGDDGNNLNSLLQPHKVSLSSKHSKLVQYHVEAIVNQSLYQDFENRAFQRNGASRVLNPSQECLERFQSFVSLRNLSWDEVMRKGTKYYSEEFSEFCDGKMSGVITALGLSKPWPEHTLRAFFVAAKCVWLLHLLAFSFDPPLAILRVGENAPFEAVYMEDIFGQRPSGRPSRVVKITVMPGFYVLDKVLKCKVLCSRYKAVT